MRPVCVILAAYSLSCSAALAEGSFRLASGQYVDTPPIAGMDCAALSEKLFEIEQTGYRGTSPTPRDDADLPLLAYEEEAATAFYRSCVMRALGSEKPSVAFSEGYSGKN